MPLPDIVADTLRRYIRRHSLSPDSVLFPTEAGIPFNATALNRFMHKYARRTGLSAGGVHIFRHTYAKLMARNGCPSIVLSHCLTHASVQQSEHYVNLYGNELRQACDKYNPVVVLLKEHREEKAGKKQKHRLKPMLSCWWTIRGWTLDPNCTERKRRHEVLRVGGDKEKSASI